MSFAYDDGLYDAELAGSAADGAGPARDRATTDDLRVAEDLTTPPSGEHPSWSPVDLKDPAGGVPDGVERRRPLPGGRDGHRGRGRRLSGLDGLRAVAVLSVVLFHLDYSLVPGGFLGVDVFFVISGFLITNLIATEILENGRLRLGRFYLRRARRLLPTVLVLLIVVTIASATLWRDQLATVRGGVLSSLFYVTNWWLIADHQSYFVATGRPTMVQHLWSLAIEEQYYLVWSAVVMAIAGVLLATHRSADPARRLRLVVVVALVLAVASTLIMAWYAVQSDLPYGGSTSRVYFGSDTHTMGLFLGSAAGAWLALRHARLAAALRPPAARSPWLLATDVIGVVALAMVIYQFFTINEFSPRLFRGGFLALDAVVLVAILCCVRAGSLFGRGLDIRPLRWVGQRSYSIYIWHWPVAVVTRPGLDVHGPLFLVNAERLALILGLSTLSYHFIEVPLRAGGYRRWRSERREPTRRGWEIGAVLLSLVAALSLVIAAHPVDAKPPRIAQPTLPTTTPSASRIVHHQSPAPTKAGSRHITHQTHAPAPPKPSISAFGDSVLLGAQSALRQHTKHLRIDAVEGRQAYDVLDDVATQANAGQLEPNVLIHVGDNGIISPDQLKDTLRRLSDRRRVLLMTVRVPRDWQGPNNQIIRSVGAQFANVDVVDWDSMSSGKSNWLYSDGIHLTPDGAAGYAQIVLNALKS